MNSKFIIVEGNIGAGKTSLVQILAEKYKLKAVYEQFEDNPFLPKFYDEPERFAFNVEMSFLADRYKQISTVLNNRDLFFNGIIFDYHIHKSLIFARITLKEHEFKLYRDIFNIIWKKVPIPDLFVYLHKSPEKLYENINIRKRIYEKSINIEYLKNLEESYFTFFRQHLEIPLLVIDTENKDFINNPDDLKMIDKQIMEKLH